MHLINLIVNIYTEYGVPLDIFFVIVPEEQASIDMSNNSHYSSVPELASTADQRHVKRWSS